MPVVLRQGGFTVRIFLPPREHGPPHVHVERGGGTIVLELPTSTRGPRIRSVRDMPDHVAVAAFHLVEAHATELHAAWRRYHG